MKWTRTVAFLALNLAAAAGQYAYSAELPVAKADEPISFPLDVAIVDPASKDKLPPYIVMFEAGKDKNAKDVRGPLGRLETLRGPSKMFPKSNADDGLPVVLRGLRFSTKINPDATLAGYEVDLLGEFNLVKVGVSKEEMQKFLSGEPTTFTLRGEKNYGVFAYMSSVKMQVQLRGREVFIYQIDADFNFREGFYTYTSASKRLMPPPRRGYLYRGEISPLPQLPAI